MRIVTGLILGILASACSFRRTAEVPRAQAQRIGSQIVVVDEHGDRHAATVRTVRPLGAQTPLPARHVGRPPPLSAPAPAEDVLETWRRDPTWRRAEAAIDVEEPAGTWAIVGGGAIGLVAGGVAAYALTSCSETEGTSCEDSDTARIGVLFVLVPVGALLGGLFGDGAHQLFGGGDYRVVTPP